MFKQSFRDSLELQSSLSPLIASQVQLALFHLLKSFSLQLPIVDIPSIDYIKLSEYSTNPPLTQGNNKTPRCLQSAIFVDYKKNGILGLLLFSKYNFALKKVSRVSEIVVDQVIEVWVKLMLLLKFRSHLCS